jgi:hypothetical protein
VRASRGPRLSLGGIAAAVCLAAAPPAALAWVRTAQAAGDPQTTWIVTPHSITVRSSDPVLLSFVRGSRVLLGCASSPAVATYHPGRAIFWGPSASSITARVDNRIGGTLFERGP